MQFIDNLSLKNLKTIIIADYPSLKIKSTKIINNGWDFLALEINNKYIFRFPRQQTSELIDYKNNIERMRAEIRVLNGLKNKISLQIPKVKYVGKKFAYFGYQKINGQKLSMSIIKKLNDRQYNQLVADVAKFLKEIHKALSLKQAKKLGVLYENYDSYHQLITSKIIRPKKITDQKIYNFIVDTVKEYKKMIPKKQLNVFLYNDLHGDNMAFDKSRGRLNGIFDFSDVMIGDIHLDFIYHFDINFMQDLINKYQQITNIKNLNKRRAIIYTRINEISDLAAVINQPNCQVYKRVIKDLKKWQKEKNIYYEKIFAR
ncbi:MAG: aminoglycoside phosphotransferase family protein [Patescibacteria group bacterium]|jgi:aminoglycoside phosphotransferase (APT) family kinase protein